MIFAEVLMKDLSLIKSFGTMELEYKCANCIIKEFWKNTVNKRN